MIQWFSLNLTNSNLNVQLVVLLGFDQSQFWLSNIPRSKEHISYEKNNYNTYIAFKTFLIIKLPIICVYNFSNGLICWFSFSGAIKHTNTTQAYVLNVDSGTFLSVDTSTDILQTLVQFKGTNTTQAHVQTMWTLAHIYWNSLFLKEVIFPLTSFLCNIMACCSSWSLPLTQLSVVYFTDRSVRKRKNISKCENNLNWTNDLPSVNWLF